MGNMWGWCVLRGKMWVDVERKYLKPRLELKVEYADSAHFLIYDRG